MGYFSQNGNNFRFTTLKFQSIKELFSFVFIRESIDRIRFILYNIDRKKEREVKRNDLETDGTHNDLWKRM